MAINKNKTNWEEETLTEKMASEIEVPSLSKTKQNDTVDNG